MNVSREEQGYSFASDDEAPEEEPQEEPEPDPFEGLEPEVAERVRTLLAEREQSTRAQIRQRLQEHGLDVTDDGAPALRDAQKLGWLGVGPSREREPRRDREGASSPPPALAAEEALAEPPDPVMEPAAFMKWHQTSLERAVKAAVAPLVETLQAQRADHVETAIDIAMAKVPAAVTNFAPRFQDLLTHPEFDARMREALATIQPGQWKDPQNLARVAAMLAIDLDRGQAPAKPAARDREGRFASPAEVGRAAVSRATLAQSGPSREAGRQVKGNEPSEVDRAIGEALGISAEEATLLRQDTTGDASAALRKQRLEKMRGGRR